jgi:hypothetical protein
VSADDLDDPPPPLGRERPAAWVLERRDRVQKCRLGPLNERGLERIRAQPLLVHGQRDDLCAQLAENLQRAVVSRLLDEDASPVPAEALREEDEALKAAVGHEDTVVLDTVALGDPAA